MKRPFFVLLIIIIASIVLFRLSYSLILSLVFLAALCCAYYIWMRKKVRLIYVVLLFFASASFILYSYYIFNCNYDLKNYENENADIYLQILSSPEEKSNYIQVYAKAYGVEYDGAYEQINQKVVLNVYGEPKCDINPGDKYKAEGKIVRPKNVDTNGEFDYNLYLKSKRVYSIIQISADNFKFLDEGNLFLYIDKIYDIKDAIEKKLSSYMPSYAIDTVKGILWGDELSNNDLSDDLTTIGASHILSVSGLHVGYIYLFLTLIFKKTKFNIKIQTLIILSVLFIYAAMCAFSVSIIRACIMFGIIQCSKIYKKLYDPLSSLSLAAIIILALNPFVLFTASFQLSFTAVTGIIFFVRVLNNKILSIKSKLLRNPVQIIAITICVQLTTLPVILYHFSNVSLVSVFSNVIIIPLTGIIVISSFIGMILCFLPFMGWFFTLLSYEIKVLIYFADLFSKANYANISLDKMHISEVAIFYIILFLIFGYFDKNNKKIIYLTSAAIFACAVYSFVKVII